MATLDRYFLLTLVTGTAIVTGAFAMAIWLTQSLRFLDMAVNGGAPLGAFLTLVLLTLPNFLAAVFPISLFIVVVHAYNKFLTDREVLVAQAAGIGHWTLARPAILLGLIGALVIAVLSFWGGPLAQTEMKERRDAIRSDYAGALIREGVFNSFGEGITVYVRDRLSGGVLSGIMIHEQPDDGPAVTVMAKRGAIIQTEDGPRALVMDGTRQEIDPGTGRLSQLEFERYAFDLQVIAPQIGVRWREASERTLPELLNPTGPHLNDETRRAFMAEAHIRMAQPLSTLGFTMIAVAVMMAGEFRRRGLGQRVWMAAGLGIAALAANLAAASAVRDSLSLAPLPYAAALLPGLVAAALLHRPKLRGVPA